MQPLGIHVTVRPLSPSSGRIRQAPACRRACSTERIEHQVCQAGELSYRPEPKSSPGPAEEVEPESEPKFGSGIGEVVKSWERVAAEMDKSDKENCKNTQRDLDSLFNDEKASGAVCGAEHKSLE